MPFRRVLDGSILPYLKTTAPRWWRDVLAARYQGASGEERRLLIAVRDRYLSIYADGQSVLEAHFDARGGHPQLRGKIHCKYIHGRDAGDDYLAFDGQVVGPFDGRKITQGPRTVAYEGAATLQGWIERALGYAKEEKKGIAAIAHRHPNVIDVEMAMPARRPSSLGARAVAPQVDIVALEQAGGGIRAVFYEAKLFSNKELRADDLRPKVLEQLAKYGAYLEEAGVRAEVVPAYREACRVLCEIHAMRGAASGDLVRDVARGAPLDLDPEVRLLVFGYAADRVGQGTHWHRHEEALRARCTLLMAERAQDIRLPCGAAHRG